MPILYSFKFKNIFYTGQTCCLTQVILKTLDKGALPVSYTHLTLPTILLV